MEVVPLASRFVLREKIPSKYIGIFYKRIENNFCEYEKRWYYPLYYLGFRPDKTARAALEIYNMKQYQAVPIMLRTPFCLKTSLPLPKHGTLEYIGD